MKKLTGKSKDAFYEWMNTQPVDELLVCFDISLNALIIEWFDSVGIYISIKSKFGQNKQRQRFGYSLLNYVSMFAFDSRTEATNFAIEKANLLFNEKH